MECGTPVQWGRFLLFCVPQSVRTKETNLTRPWSPTPCKQALSLNRRQKYSSDQKRNLSLRHVLCIPSRCCFAGSLQFSSSIAKHETNPLQFLRCFSLSYQKNSSRKTFLVECLRSNSLSEGAENFKRL